MISLLLYIPIVIFIGSRMRWLGNVMHECSHGTFMVSPKGNVFLGHVIAVLLLECFDTYQKDHFNHHRFLGNPQKDVDCARYQQTKCTLFKNNGFNVFCSILNPYNWWLSLKNIAIVHAKTKSVVVFKLMYLGILGFCLYASFRGMFLYVFVPYVTSYQALKLFSDIIDHDNVYDEPNIRNRAHNHIFKWKILNWVFFPRHDAYHLVHHLYPRHSVAECKRIHNQLIQKKGAYALKNHSCDLQKLSRSGIHK